jgi:hypothetical protein
MPREAEVIYLLLAALVVAPGAWAAFRRLTRRRRD